MSTDSPSDVSAKTGPKLEGEALLSALRTQLDFYFSRQNLATDTYLQSQMNAEKYVALDIIAAFRKIKMLTEDKTQLIQAVKGCKNLLLNPECTMVKPNHKVERNTLILRDIPDTVSEDEVRAIFNTCPTASKITNIHSDINDTWFVVFENEEACTDTAFYIQSNAFTPEAVTFQGKPVQARVKSENIMRGFYQQPAPFYPPTTPYNPYAAPVYVAPPFYPGANSSVGSVKAHKQGGGAAAAGGVTQKIDMKIPLPNNEPKKKKNKSNNNDVATAAPAAAASPVPATGDAPKKKKKKGAEESVAGSAAATNNNNNTSNVTSSTPSHPPRTYTREQMAAVIEHMIATAKTTPLQRPDGYELCHDAEHAVIRQVPIMTFSLLEPFPVIYPASPSPLLAAQPHHSSSLPFLDLMAHSTPVVGNPAFYANNQHATQQQLNGKKKSKGGNSPLLSSQVSGLSLSSSVSSAPASRPTTAAAVVAASLAVPLKPQPPKKKPATTNNDKKEEEKKDDKKSDDKKKDSKSKQKSKSQPSNNGNNTANSSSNSSAPASQSSSASATKATPAANTPPVVTFASRVGAISPQEAAAKAAAQKKAKEEKARLEKEKAEAEQREKAEKDKPATSSTASTSTANTSSGSKLPESPTKPAFSYAAIIKQTASQPQASPKSK